MEIKNEMMIVGFVAIVLLILFFSFGLFGTGNYAGFGMMQWMFPGMIFMMLFMFIFWAVFIIWLVKQIQEPRRRLK
jgi:uncharacterized membrane protein